LSADPPLKMGEKGNKAAADQGGNKKDLPAPSDKPQHGVETKIPHNTPNWGGVGRFFCGVPTPKAAKEPI